MTPTCPHCGKKANLRAAESLTGGPLAGHSIRRCSECNRIREVSKSPGVVALEMRMGRKTTAVRPFGEITMPKGQRIIGYVLKHGEIPKGEV